MSLDAGCCEALIQSSTLQNNWTAVEQGSLFWQAAACSVTAHYSPIRWSERSSIGFLGPGWGWGVTPCRRVGIKHGVPSLVAMCTELKAASFAAERVEAIPKRNRSQRQTIMHTDTYNLLANLYLTNCVWTGRTSTLKCSFTQKGVQENFLYVNQWCKPVHLLTSCSTLSLSAEDATMCRWASTVTFNKTPRFSRRDKWLSYSGSH